MPNFKPTRNQIKVAGLTTAAIALAISVAVATSGNTAKSLETPAHEPLSVEVTTVKFQNTYEVSLSSRMKAIPSKKET